jgi:transglutaminase-like putative cysteine protease
MSEEFDHLRIVHQTVYQYARPVTFLPHRLVLRPRENHDLRVEHLTLTTEPPAGVAWSLDIFGNSIALAAFIEPGSVLRIRSEVDVRRVMRAHAQSPAGVVSLAHPLQYEPLEQAAIAAYLQPVYPTDAETVQSWMRTVPATVDATAEDLVLHYTSAVHRLIRYERREEKGVQSPATTITLGTGSCRDAACLLMEALRHLGIATRFASGYLDCAATRAARGVTHAWTEVYFPGLGWRGYDATTGQRCTYRHIVTGVSHHPRGVMPISGRFLGAAADYQEMSVQVEFSQLPPTKPSSQPVSQPSSQPSSQPVVPAAMASHLAET